MGVDRVFRFNIAHGITTTFQNNLAIPIDAAYYDVTDISGKGLLRYIQVMHTAVVGSELCLVWLSIDGKTMHPAKDFFNYNATYASLYSHPLQLIKYAVDGGNSLIWYFDTGVRFDTGFKLTCQRPLLSGNQGTAYTYGMYEAYL